MPVLGALFRSTNYQKNETDLVIIVTPRLVRPVRPGQQLATPFDKTLQSNDVDLFLMGDTERKKRYTDYVTSGGGLQGPYGHILERAVTDANQSAVFIDDRSGRRRSAASLAALGLAAALGGCSPGVPFDDPTAEYTQRTMLVSTVGGDSQAANTAMQTATPWPRNVMNTNIPGDGQRMVKAVERYESGSSASDQSSQSQASGGLGSGRRRAGQGAGAGMGITGAGSAAPGQQ